MRTFRTVLRIIVLFALLAPPVARVAANELPPAPINFVFILVDDLGWRDVGCFGSTFYETPHVDALAASGMRFTSAYAACPVCSPTRVSIQTGKYPARLDTTDWFGDVQPDEAMKHPRFQREKMLPAAYVDQLPHEEVTIAEALREHGYRTFFAGKWHLGPEGYWPESQGYEINKGGWERGGPYGPGKYFVPYGNPRLEDGPAGEHLPDRLATETVKFIEQSRDEPFLAFLSFYSVHTPLVTREDLKAKYAAKAKLVTHAEPRFVKQGSVRTRQVQDHAVYGGMVESMDLAVGKVLDALDELRLAGNTAVIFMSDNGGLSTAAGWPTSNAPLRTGKGWLYEGGIREPMIVRWPSVVEPQSVCDQPVTSTDFFPTMLEMAGLPARPQDAVDGKGFVPLLRGEDQFDRGPIFWHYPHYHLGNPGTFPGGAVRDGDWKLIERYDADAAELYNLAADIGERNNLADAEPARRDAMLKLLHDWRREVDAKMPTPNPAWQK